MRCVLNLFAFNYIKLNMVSTRGPRYKFTEGERVLCYEPDPTKAKVLYDSKVLEVIEQKDKRGRRAIEYLIHFQGWNSSWDRCVGEELVLKDTENNRQLQRNLAHKAQLQIGAYLYRKERKKVAGPSSGKRPRIERDGESSALSSPEDGNEDGDGVPGSDSSDSSSSSCVSDCDYQSDDHGTAAIPLGPGLRQRLTLDYELVVCEGLMVRLPCRPSALQLLEDCVRHHTTRTVAAHTPPPPQADMQEQVHRLNILREVADGLRIYLDFILRDQLLYEGEREQYQQAVADGTIKDILPPVVKDEEESGPQGYPDDYSHLPPFLDGLPNILIKREVISPCEDVQCKSEPKSSSPPNHREPSPTWHLIRIKTEDNNTSDNSKEPPTKEDEEYTVKKSTETNNIWDNCNQLLPGMANQTRSREASRTSRDSPSHYSMREQRGHSSGVSEAASDSQLDLKEESEIGSTLSSQEDSQSDSRQIDDMESGRAASRVSSIHGEEGRDGEGSRDRAEGVTNCSKPNNLRSNLNLRNPKMPSRRLRSHRPRSRTLDDRPPNPQPGPSRTTSTSEASVAELNGGVAEEFKEALDWQIVPPDHPPYPAAVYGAIHLARLFVKLPEYLSVINMPESKLELIVQYVEYFVQYLEEHEEWFGSSFYYDPNPSTS